MTGLAGAFDVTKLSGVKTTTLPSTAHAIRQSLRYHAENMSVNGNVNKLYKR